MTEMHPPDRPPSDAQIQTGATPPKERIYNAPPYPLDGLLGGKEAVRSLIVDTLRGSQEPTFSGVHAYLYEVPQPLTEPQVDTLLWQLGRVVGTKLLVRIAQPEVSDSLKTISITNKDMFIREARLYGVPAIAAFAAATSSLVEYEPGKKAFLVERLPEDLTWPTNKEQMTERLDHEDVARIAYQFAMVSEEFHGQIESPGDMKSLVYDEYVGRIICFDLAPTRTYYLGRRMEGVERATMVLEDIERFGKNLREYILRNVSPDILHSISLGEGETLADIESICRSHAHRSLWQIAQRIDRAFEGKFAGEYEHIVGHPPYEISRELLTHDIQEGDWLEAKTRLDHKAAGESQREQEQKAKKQRLNIVGPDLPFDPADYPEEDLVAELSYAFFLVEGEMDLRRLRGGTIEKAREKIEERFTFLQEQGVLNEKSRHIFGLASKKTRRTFLEELLRKYVEIGDLTEASKGEAKRS